MAPAAAFDFDLDELKAFAFGDTLGDFFDPGRNRGLHTNKKVGFRPLIRFDNSYSNSYCTPNVGDRGSVRKTSAKLNRPRMHTDAHGFKMPVLIRLNPCSSVATSLL